ncbi:hypothetical protein OPT61_g5577 [Boeremia exigua]|uniref:Uncharacterized protein n=1 Tax=Boeremia exigua TaxID=749465 RepID=A0ACC2I9W6_9PLEO|nr:hypothetical protein OPT61_g5577 [Boeremia exigua]
MGPIIISRVGKANHSFHSSDGSCDSRVTASSLSRSPLTPAALCGPYTRLGPHIGSADFHKDLFAVDRQQQAGRFSHPSNDEGVDGAQDRATNGLPSSRIARPLAR